MIAHGTPKGATTAFRIVALWLSVNMGELAMAAYGLTTIKSNSGPQETMARLEAAVTAKGMTVFAHIDHGAGAAEDGLPLRSTDLLIFGDPKGSTPVMQSVQTAAIDLPLKALVWQDKARTTWLSYNVPAWIADRHGAGPETEAAIHAMTAALDAIAASATSASANQ
jgi:uncharacterized protein (DUF302 family)